jgi:predicted N-acetyltransferase YhbS
MAMPDVLIRLQSPADHHALTQLNERAFGPGRFARTAYRVREGAVPDPRLNLFAVVDGAIAGSVQFTPITIGGKSGALLLGPLIIDDPYKNQGYGLGLMLEGLRRARDLDYELVILVGDLPYYARAGFARAPREQLEMPGPVDPTRLLYSELLRGALANYRGLLRGGQAPKAVRKRTADRPLAPFAIPGQG